MKEKISKDLLESARKKPKATFKIIVFVNKDEDVSKLPLKDFKTYMGNLLSANASGEEITKLACIDSVKSIEIDEEVSTL